MNKRNLTLQARAVPTFLLLAFLSLAFSQHALGQCNNASPFGTVTAPSAPGVVTITTCNYAGEYATINAAQAGATYQFTSSVTTDFLTVRQGTPGGTVLGTGTGTVVVTPTATGPIYLHVNTNPACGAQNTCRTTTVECTSCTAPTPPANDLCANAIAITVPSTTVGTTVNATADAAPTCVTTNTAPGVWYTFTNPVGNGVNRVVLNTCLATSYDSKLSVYTGTCAALTCVTGNDDFCGLQSQVSVNTTGGNTTYRVLVHGFGSATGAFSLFAQQLASITNIALGAQTPCDPNTNLYSQTLTLNYLSAPAAGTLLVNGQSFPITGSPQTVVLTGLPSNGLPVNVTASFSADPASQVTVNGLFTAPQKCNLCKVVCPNDIVVTLGGGECGKFINYNITTTGDCVDAQQVNGFQGPFAPANWTVGLVNSNGNVNTAGAPASIVITGPDNGSGAAGQTNYSITVNGTGNITFNWSYTTVDGPTFDPFGYTKNGVFTLLTTGFAQNQSGTASVPVVAGDVFAFSQRSTDNIFGPGITTITNFSAPALVTNTPSLVTGLPSGSWFGIGTTPVSYQIPNGIGGLSTCSFQVKINEFPNPTNSLSCNDLVQISLDEDCSSPVNADMILEGGPYGCYESRYTVMILSNFGANLGNTVNASFIGPQWTVKVVDNVTGQSCWGKIKVEDKLPPVIQCENLTLPCTAPSTAVSAVKNFTSSNTPLNINDLQTVEATIPVTGIPADARVLDVNLTLDINHTWIGDLTIDLFSPTGTKMGIWRQNCAATDNIKVTFDDEATDCQNACAAYTNGQTLRPPACLNVPGLDVNFLDVFDNDLASGNWRLVVNDGVAGDQGVINSVTLNIQYYSASAVYQPVVIENCSAYTLSYVDAVTEGNCSGAARTILRTWMAVDANGNTAVPCTQTITFTRPTLDDVEPPKDIEWTCSQYAAFPNVIGATPLQKYISDSDPGTFLIDVNLDPACDDQDLLNQDNPDINSTNTANGGNGCPGNGLDDADVLALTGSGIPTIAGTPLVEICGISYEHTDLKVTVCPGTFKIVRKWTLIDWCANPVKVQQFNQVIKVVDNKAPTIAAPADLTIDVYATTPASSNNPHAVCTGVFAVPPASGVADDCSGVGSFKTEIWTVNAAGVPVSLLGSINANGGVFQNIPMFQNGTPAKYLVRYIVTDGCGNQGFDDTNITLRDKVPPIAICDEITEVAVTNNGLVTGQSCSKLFASTLDDGSYDNCKPVYFLMAKMDDSSSPNIFNRCYYPSRNFCCADLGNQTVIVLVLDGDPTPFFSNLNSPSLGCDGTPGLFLTPSFSALNSNSCMVSVQVTDKLPPVRTFCPADVRISCDEYADKYETALQGKTPAQQCQILTDAGFGEAAFYDNCSLNITCTANINLDQCLDGVITRTWTATDNAGNPGLQNCQQRIFVDHVSDWSVEFPADITVACGNTAPDFGEPIIFRETCELVAVSYHDQVFNVVPDACYKIQRTWTVINWCVVGSNVDQEVVELSEAQLWNQGVTTLADRDINGDGFFNSAEVNSNRSHRTFRDSWNNTPGKKKKPVRADNQSTGPITDPDTDPDSDPWDGYITYQQTIKVIDTVDPVFTNGCTIPDVCIVANNCGATLLLPQPAVSDCSSNVNLTTQVKIGGVWLNGPGPYLNVAPGTYEVHYVAKDNCNNQTACSTTVTVKDCKKPTPYCKNGLVIELMQTGMVQIWGADFNAGSFDNCPGTLKFSFSSNVNDTHRTFTCNDVGQQPVQIWVTDAVGNQDYCETFIIVQANMGQCGGGGGNPLVAGNIATEAQQGVQNVNVQINGTGGSQSLMTNSNGAFNFAAVPALGDYTVTPHYDMNPLNGVTTFDLVLISKHILGITPLGSPYKIIAADANKSNSVTTFDLVELRKLILFINPDFPNNTSWRFVDKNFVFPNPANPFQAQFPEIINFNNLAVSQLNTNFVAVKIGDVNSSAATNLLGSNEDRTTTGDLVFNSDDLELKKGEIYNIEFKTTDFNVSGYQFTLNFDREALEFLEVVPGLADASNFGTTLLREGALTTSWNSDRPLQLQPGEIVFALAFKAKQDGRLSDLLSINSRYTVAEAYDADNQLMNVALAFNNLPVAGGFELYQNTPNPFTHSTNIGFWLPEATSATLTISDVQGKVVYLVKGEFAKGFNQVELKRSDLPASGVLYYRLETATDAAVRKMVLID